MWYLITGLLCCLPILFSFKKRKANPTLWLILSIVIPPIGFGLWQAKKPLIGNEKRYGGAGWNTCKWAILIYTLLCALGGIWAMVAAGNAVSRITDQAEQAGAAIGSAIGMGLIAGMWFGGVVLLLIIGLILKKPITETAQDFANAQ